MSRIRLALFGVLSIAVIGAAGCTTGGGGSAPAPNQLQQFCNFWADTAEAPPEPDHAVLVKNEVVAFADSTSVDGASCTDSGAQVDLNGAVLAEGEEILSEPANPESEPVAAVTGDEIGAGQPVLENIQLRALNAQITSSGIRVTGNVAVTLSGTTSTLGFIGSVTNLNNWSVGISTSGLSIPGVTTSPVVFSGTLAVRNGVPTLSMSASASSVRVGDISVTGANLNVVASPSTGVDATISGSLKVGPSTASGTVHVAFDKAGGLVTAVADVNAHLVGTQADGKKIDLTGTVHFEGNSDETAASFNASGVLGDMVINEANGSLTLATNKATFVGKLDVAQGDNFIRFDGSIVWDGITAYTPFLSLEAGGGYSGTLPNGQTVSVAGTLSTTIVGGQIYTVVTGDLQVGTLKANGMATVGIDGTTTTLEIDATLVDAGFSGQLQGAVLITDGRAEIVQLDASVSGPLQLGDVTLTGASMSIRSSYGSPLDINFNGGIQVGSRANVSGSLAGSFGPDGTLISLEGSVDGSLQLDTWGIVGFSGSVIASSEQVALSGSGSLTTLNFPFGVSFNGTFTSSLTSPTWSLHGSGQLRLGSLTVAKARLSLSHTAGMAATNSGFYFSIVGISTYFEANFYMAPGGGCDHVQITQGPLLAKPILALALPGVIGCPVSI